MASFQGLTQGLSRGLGPILQHLQQKENEKKADARAAANFMRQVQMFAVSRGADVGGSTEEQMQPFEAQMAPEHREGRAVPSPAGTGEGSFTSGYPYPSAGIGPVPEQSEPTGESMSLRVPTGKMANLPQLFQNILRKEKMLEEGTAAVEREKAEFERIVEERNRLEAGKKEAREIAKEERMKDNQDRDNQLAEDKFAYDKTQDAKDLSQKRVSDQQAEERWLKQNMLRMGVDYTKLPEEEWETTLAAANAEKIAASRLRPIQTEIFRLRRMVAAMGVSTHGEEDLDTLIGKYARGKGKENEKSAQKSRVANDALNRAVREIVQDMDGGIVTFDDDGEVSSLSQFEDEPPLNERELMETYYDEFKLDTEGKQRLRLFLDEVKTTVAAHPDAGPEEIYKMIMGDR